MELVSASQGWPQGSDESRRARAEVLRSIEHRASDRSDRTITGYETLRRGTATIHNGDPTLVLSPAGRCEVRKRGAQV